MYKKIFSISSLLVVLAVPRIQAEELVVPNFNLPQIQNTQSLSNQDLLGKVIILNVWESSCKPCIEEHPLLVQLAQQGIPVYGINMQDNLEKARRFLAKWGNLYMATALDSEGLISKQLGVIGTPVTFVVDQQGKIRHKKEGPLNEQDVQEFSSLIQKLNQ